MCTHTQATHLKAEAVSLADSDGALLIRHDSSEEMSTKRRSLRRGEERSKEERRGVV